MNQDNKEKVIQIRKLITEATDEQLEHFMASYAIGTVAGLLIQNMNDLSRQSFFQQMKIIYPQYWDESS